MRVLSGNSRPNKVGMIMEIATPHFSMLGQIIGRVNKIAKIRDEEGREWKKQNDI
jgi:hypothetical protein